MFGCVEIYSARFIFRRDSVFNAETYLDYLEQVADRYYPQPVIWIQDNAPYHKEARVREWFSVNREWWTVANLPSYSPELNASERIWRHTRVTATHNRYFSTQAELNTTLTRVFRSIQRRPEQIRGYLRPFL